MKKIDAQKLNFLRVSLAVAAAIAATSLTLLPEARAELVIMKPDVATAKADASAVSVAAIEERESTRQIVNAAQKMKNEQHSEANTAQSERAPAPISIPAVVATAPAPVAAPVVTAPAVVVAPAPVAPAPAPIAASEVAAPEVHSLSKSEMLRRERVREELKNEDLLQERLERLRLQDEQKRLDQLTGAASKEKPAETVNPTPVAPVVLSAPVGPVSLAAPVAPAAAPVVAPALPAYAPPSAEVTTQAPAAASSAERDRVAFSLMPRAGLSNMTGFDQFDVHGRYAGGLSLSAAVNDVVSIEMGYTFSEYGVALQTSNPLVMNYRYFNPTASFDTLAMKQNVFDMGMKLYLMDSDSKVRPYLAGGAAYSKSFLNYDPRINAYQTQVGAAVATRDYEGTAYSGYVGAGMDFKLGKSVSFSLGGRYYSMLSARENQQVNPYNFINYGAYGYNTYALTTSTLDADKQIKGSSLIRSNYYSVQAGVSFSF